MTANTVSIHDVKEIAVETVTIFGVKGLKGVAFTKTFKTEAAMQKWLEKEEGNVEVHGYSFSGTNSY